MHAATLEEMKRRGRMLKGVETGLPARPVLTKIQSNSSGKRRHDGIAEAPLTRGQVNAVRSAFKAGITPSQIAREFGISQSDVKKALANDGRKPK
jgi:DNA invertase Pin-like site-specific DNA recombinase